MVNKKVEDSSGKTHSIKLDCANDKFGEGVTFERLINAGYNPQEMNSVTMSDLLGIEVKTVRIDNSFNAVFVIDTKKDKKGK